MKNFFKKFKSYGFWVSLSAGIIVLLNALGRAFGFSIENQIVEDVIMSIASLLVILGVVSMNDKDKKNNKNDSQNENIDKGDEPIEDGSEKEQTQKDTNEIEDDNSQIDNE